MSPYKIKMGDTFCCLYKQKVLIFEYFLLKRKLHHNSIMSRNMRKKGKDNVFSNEEKINLSQWQ